MTKWLLGKRKKEDFVDKRGKIGYFITKEYTKSIPKIGNRYVGND